MGYDPKAVKEQIIEILKIEFPKTKFTVRSKSGKIYVDWIDGPTAKMVKSFVSKFGDMATDYTGSYHDSGHASTTEWVSYVFPNRMYSDDALEAAYEEVVFHSVIEQVSPERIRDVNSAVVAENFVIKDGWFTYLNGHLFKFGNQWLDQYIGMLLANTDLTDSFDFHSR